jgi:hypothetical protein
MIFGGGRIVSINVIKVKEEVETYYLAQKKTVKPLEEVRNEL